MLDGVPLRSARLVPTLLTAACVLAYAPAAGADTLFEPLGHLPFSGGIGSIPSDVSGNGAVVVGRVYDDVDYMEDGTATFRWRRGEMEELTACDSVEVDVSDDGRRVAGACRVGPLADPAIWVDGTYQAVPLSGDFAGSYIYGMSGDGLIVFGNVGHEIEIDGLEIELTEAFRATTGGAATVIGRMPGDYVSYFIASSMDGSAAAIESRTQSFGPFGGVDQDDIHGARFLHGAEGGTLQPLGGGQIQPYDISADGKTVVGDSESVGGFRWTDGVFEQLPRPLGALGVLPLGVSGDGKTIVGMYADEDQNLRACIWTEEDGVRDLQDMMELEVGVDLQGWTLTAATAISRDGTTIVGYGKSPSWPYETGWRLGPPAPAVQMRVEAARMTIPDYQGEEEHEFRRDPALFTLYGRTVVPIVVSVADETNDGAPLPDATVVMSVEGVGVGIESSLLGLSLDPDDASGPEELEIDTGASGEVTVYLHLEALYANVAEDEPNATGLALTARWESAVETVTIPVEDNRESILSRYRIATDYFPNGAVDGFRNGFRAAFLPPLDPVADLPGIAMTKLFAPGNTGVGTVLCNTYQARSLSFLNDLRHSDDGWLLNGLDYSPLQTAHTDHHFVGLYPHELPYDHPRALILDSWLPQRIAYYTWEEWVAFMDIGGRGANVVPDVRHDPDNPGACVVECGPGNFVPPPYPAAGGRYPWFPENARLPIEKRFDGCLMIPPAINTTLPDGTVVKQIGWCERNGFVGIERQLLQLTATDHASVLVGSPVRFLVTQPDGQRFGFTDATAESYVNDLAGEFSTAFAETPKTDGGRGWYIEAPPGRQFRIDFPATDDGTMDVAVVGTDDVVWGGWRDVPVKAGQTTGLDVDLDATCPSFAVPGGIAIPCERPTACTGDAECPSDDPCTPRACVEGVCQNRPADGLAAATCACDRPRPAACDVPKLPRPLLKTSGKACKLLRSKGMSNEKKRAKLLAKAAKGWTAATKALGKRAVAKKLSEECRAALAQRYGEAGLRLDAVRASQ